MRGRGAADDDILVLLTFDVDGPSGYLREGWTSATDISQGEFVVVGMRRVLELLGRHRVPATFFFTGHSAETYPRLVDAVVESGHEVGHHGWLHEVPSTLSVDEERAVLERGSEAIERIAGARPSGYRAPGWSLSSASTALLAEGGFVYDSSQMGDDHAFYWCRTGDATPLDGPMSFGPRVPVVEVPVAWHLDDVPMFEFFIKPGRILPGLRSPTEALEIWEGDLAYLLERPEPGVLTLTLHPEVVGRGGHRLRVLDRFLSRAREHDRVRFSRCLPAVERWIAEEGGQPPVAPHA